MFSRLRSLLFENEKRISVCWLITLSIATRGKPVRTSRPSTRRHSNYWSPTLGPETYENFSIDESWLSRQSLATEPTNHLELSQKLAAQEKEMIEAALRETGGRVFGPSGAAAKLGIHRSTLESKIASLKINKYRFKTASASNNS